jgi:cob(I)alamin adenosyltransferase
MPTALILCAQLFYTNVVTNGFEIVTSHNDGNTTAVVAKKGDKEVDHYVAQLATIDTLTEKIAVARGYTKTDIRCLVGNISVFMYIQHRLIKNKA